MKRRLLELVERMRAEFGDFDYKACVDTAPLLERSYARLAGLEADLNMKGLDYNVSGPRIISATQSSLTLYA